MAYPKIPLRYLRGCPDRVVSNEEIIDAYLRGEPATAPSTSEHTTYVCMRITKQIGHTMGAEPMMCAECMLAGTVNEEYIHRRVSSFMRTMLDLVRLGFYQDEGDVEHLLKTAYPYAKASEGGREYMAQILEECVRLKRLTVEKAMELVEKHFVELKDHDAPGKA